MTRKSETLKAKEEIQSLFKFGKRQKSESISIVYSRSNKGKPRYLFCADRFARKANQRNRIKRVLRSLIAKEGFQGSFDVAIIANTRFTEFSYEKRCTILKNLFLKLHNE